MNVATIGRVEATPGKRAADDRRQRVENGDGKNRGRRGQGYGGWPLQCAVDGQYTDDQPDQHAAAVAQEDRRGRKIKAQEGEQGPGQGEGHRRRHPLACDGRHDPDRQRNDSAEQPSNPSMPSIRFSELIAPSNQNAVKGYANKPNSMS